MSRIIPNIFVFNKGLICNNVFSNLELSKISKLNVLKYLDKKKLPKSKYYEIARQMNINYAENSSESFFDNLELIILKNQIKPSESNNEIYKKIKYNILENDYINPAALFFIFKKLEMGQKVFLLLFQHKKN